MNEYTEKLISGCDECPFGYGTSLWTKCKILSKDVTEYANESDYYPDDCPAIKGVLLKIKSI